MLCRIYRRESLCYRVGEVSVRDMLVCRVVLVLETSETLTENFRRCVNFWRVETDWRGVRGGSRLTKFVSEVLWLFLLFLLRENE